MELMSVCARMVWLSVKITVDKALENNYSEQEGKCVKHFESKSHPASLCRCAPIESPTKSDSNLTIRYGNYKANNFFSNFSSHQESEYNFTYFS